MSGFSEQVYQVTNEIANMLIEKNEKYGNSALRPARVFSKATPIEQLLVRIDDKLSRFQNTGFTDEEDTVRDLIGYLVLLLIATEGNNGQKLTKRDVLGETYMR